MSSYQTIWEQYDFAGKVIEVLSRFSSPQNDRRDEPTFLTAYQLAIELKHSYIAGIDVPGLASRRRGIGRVQQSRSILGEVFAPQGEER